MKYTGHVVMDDTGIKEIQMVTDKLRERLKLEYGDGQLNTSNSLDNARVLKYTYVTGNDETPAPGQPGAVNGETQRPFTDGTLSFRDPASEEIAAEASQGASDAKDAKQADDEAAQKRAEQGIDPKAKEPA